MKKIFYYDILETISYKTSFMKSRNRFLIILSTTYGLFILLFFLATFPILFERAKFSLKAISQDPEQFKASVAEFAAKKRVYTLRQLTKYVRNLRKRMAVLEGLDLTVTKIYEGQIDTSSAGDGRTSCLIMPGPPPSDWTSTNCYWKVISIPEIDFTRGPQVQVLVRPSSTPGLIIFTNTPPGTWVDYNNISLSTVFALIDGKVYLVYKTDTQVLIDGNYKIIVTYKG